MNRKEVDMKDMKLRIALAAALIVASLGTTACQNGFMSLDLNGDKDEVAGTPGSTQNPGEAGGDIDSLVNPPDGCVPDDRFFMREVWGPAAKNSCQSCHSTQGAARDSDFILYNEGWGNYIELNMSVMKEFAATKRDGESILLLKPLGVVSHGGGAVIQEGDDVYNRLKAFVERAENPSECVATADDDFYQDVLFLDSEQTLRKATLSLAGRLPTSEELANGNIDQVLDGVMQEEAFYDRLREHFNDLLLTDMYLEGDTAIDLLDEDIFPNARYFDSIDDGDARRAERDRANDAVAREPIELVRHVVANDRPFTEVVTADYTMVNPFSAQVFGVQDQVTFNDSGDTNEWREVQIPGVPHAGLLTTATFLNRYPTTETNRNRHRSAIFYRYFLATDVLKLAERPIDPTQSDFSQNPTLFDSQCTVCHEVVDPVAGAFQNWDDQGRYAPRDFWYTDMLPPGMESDKINSADWGVSLSWLGGRAAGDPRFVDSAVEHAYRLLTGDEPLTLPTDATRSDYDAAFRAYEVQYEFFKQVGDKFIESNYNFKTLIKELAKSPYYRAWNARSVSPKRQGELATLGTARMLSPEMLHRKIIATTGAEWRVNDRAVLLSVRDFKLLYGGIDSVSITNRMKEPNALAASIARRMSNEVSCLATANDFVKPQGERLLFPTVNVEDAPGTNDAAIRENIKHLHWQLLGEKLEDGDPELERTYNLFRDVWQDGQNGDYGDSLPGMCRVDGLGDDPSYTIRSWMAVVSYMLSSYEYLYE